MAGTQIDVLLEILAKAQLRADGEVLFFSQGSSCIPDHKDLYQTIDHIKLGGVEWENFTIHYNGDHPVDNIPPWMDDNYKVYFHSPCKVVWNILGNPDFSSQMDYSPYHKFVSATNERQWCDFMSSDWVWNQAVRCCGFSHS